jgi:hypothetical protein
VYKPQKFGIDDRNWSLAAAARNGIMPRAEALEKYAQPPKETKELTAYFVKRMGITEGEYAAVIQGHKKTYRDYKTYKKRFELLRPFFYLMAKAQLIPYSFYIKYTSKTEGA